MIPAGPRLHGRRKGRPINVRKSALLENLLPQLRLDLPASGRLDPLGLYPFKPLAIWLEIGFGGGEHLAEQAALHPDIGFIGCEPFLNGTAGLLDHIAHRQLTNIRIFPDDARALLAVLPDRSLERCYLLFPDPWPKARHAKRRFIGFENLNLLARCLKPQADLQLATDAAPLAEWMREHVVAHPDYSLSHDGPSPPPDWTPTRYEQKGIAAGRKPVYLIARRH